MATIGQHILVEFQGCFPEILADAAQMKTLICHAIEELGGPILSATFHPSGDQKSGDQRISGVVLLGQSHVAVHTDPEQGSVAIDAFTSQEFNPLIVYEQLKTALKAESGDLRNLASPPRSTPPLSRNVWLTDSNKNIALSIRHKGQPLFQHQSPYQKVAVYDTFEYGRMLTVDGMTMCSEKDEHAYHEMIIHVPMLTHPQVQDVLIIGGGDGGSVRETLRHDSVKAVTMVEIDQVVVHASRTYLPTLSTAFNHPKLNLIIGDGIEFIHQAQDQSFDLIVIDSADPIGPAKGLFNPDFYTQVYRCLRPGGVMTVQSESPYFNTHAFITLHHCLQDIFGVDHTHCYLALIPTYPSGTWSFNYCSKPDSQQQYLHPVHDMDGERSIGFSQSYPLQYYNPQIHQAAFYLPTAIENLLKPPIVQETEAGMVNPEV
jgi:spermidine synthase